MDEHCRLAVERLVGYAHRNSLPALGSELHDEHHGQELFCQSERGILRDKLEDRLLVLLGVRYDVLLVLRLAFDKIVGSLLSSSHSLAAPLGVTMARLVPPPFTITPSLRFMSA